MKTKSTDTGQISLLLSADLLGTALSVIGIGIFLWSFYGFVASGDIPEELASRTQAIMGLASGLFWMGLFAYLATWAYGSFFEDVKNAKFRVKLAWALMGIGGIAQFTAVWFVILYLSWQFTDFPFAVGMIAAGIVILFDK